VSLRPACGRILSTLCPSGASIRSTDAPNGAWDRLGVASGHKEGFPKKGARQGR